MHSRANTERRNNKHTYTHTNTQVHTNMQTHAHTPATHAHCFGATPLAIFEAVACVQFQMPVCTKQMTSTPCIQTIALYTCVMHTYTHPNTSAHSLFQRESARGRKRGNVCVCLCVLVCVFNGVFPTYRKDHQRPSPLHFRNKVGREED